MEPRVGAAFGQQLVVRADLDDPPRLDEEHLLARRTVERRCAMIIVVRPGKSRSRACFDHRLGVAVERARRLVENQDARVSQDCPRDRDALALAA